MSEEVTIIKCPHCRKKYELGYTGTVDGCDKCAGVKRVAGGYAWEEGEQYAIYKANDTGKIVVQRRPYGIK